MVSLWPRSLGEVALEDRRAMADMLVAYGELAAATMLIYSVIGWSVVLVLAIFQARGRARSFAALRMTEGESHLLNNVPHPTLEDERRRGFPDWERGRAWILRYSFRSRMTQKKF